MFEKEVDAMAVNNAKKKYGLEGSICMNIEECAYVNGFQQGAEFGYNKANKWHYNGVPENENDILCQIDKDIFVVGYFHQKNKQYYTTSGEWLKTVIAWKEIVLPELKESE